MLSQEQIDNTILWVDSKGIPFLQFCNVATYKQSGKLVFPKGPARRIAQRRRNHLIRVLKTKPPLPPGYDLREEFLNDNPLFPELLRADMSGKAPKKEQGSLRCQSTVSGLG